MDEVRLSESAWRRSAHDIPAVAWVLVAAAAIELLGLARVRWLMTLPSAVVLVGLLAVTAGFTVAGLLAPER